MRRPGALDDLSPQELQVAQMAGAGLTNREIGKRRNRSAMELPNHIVPEYARRSAAPPASAVQREQPLQHGKRFVAA